jgi:hypothetical protein
LKEIKKKYCVRGVARGLNVKNEDTLNWQETIQQDKQITCRFGYAWIFLSAALALHVTDEAMTDFLSVYNPTVLAIRERLPFLPIPTFTFGVWLTGLCVGITLLFLLSPLTFRRNRILVWIAFPLSVVMFGNGLLHIAGSFYLGRAMPGVYSSPLLLLASAWLFVNALLIKNQKRIKP